jgi:hypothetical protein
LNSRKWNVKNLIYILFFVPYKYNTGLFIGEGKEKFIDSHWQRGARLYRNTVSRDIFTSVGWFLLNCLVIQMSEQNIYFGIRLLMRTWICFCITCSCMCIINKIFQIFQIALVLWICAILIVFQKPIRACCLIVSKLHSKS